MKAFLLAALLAACGSAPAPRVELPATRPPDVVTMNRFDPATTLQTKSEDVVFRAEGHDVPGTVTHPVGVPGKFAGIVLMAGSGPTDRDWNSPLLPGKNGSGKLIAEWLAAHGAVVVRFDKAAVGGNRLPVDKVTLDSYVDELRGALVYLRERPDVDIDHLMLAGNSEGGMHAIRTAIAEGGRIGGLILLSSMGRTGRDISISQNEALLAEAVRSGKMSATDAKATIDAVKLAYDAFIEGRPIDPSLVAAVPNLAQINDLDAVTAKLLRDLWSFDPAEGAAKIKVPVFIYNGLKDIQVDPQLDASRLQDKIKAAGGDVTLFLAPDANHVLEHETKSLAELKSNLGATLAAYNGADRKLDDTTLSALGNWLAKHTGK